MFYLGCHLSFAKGYEAMGHESLRIDANTFQFFTRSPRGGKAKPLNLEDLGKLNTLIEANNFKHILAHAPYTMNPCSNKDYTRDYAKNSCLMICLV